MCTPLLHTCLVLKFLLRGAIKTNFIFRPIDQILQSLAANQLKDSTLKIIQVSGDVRVVQIIVGRALNAFIVMRSFYIEQILVSNLYWNCFYLNLVTLNIMLLVDNICQIVSKIVVLWLKCFLFSLVYIYFVLLQNLNSKLEISFYFYDVSKLRLLFSRWKVRVKIFIMKTEQLICLRVHSLNQWEQLPIMQRQLFLNTILL